MKKNSIPLLSVLAVLVLSACGSEEQSVKNQAELYEVQHLPKQNSITIPKPLLGKQADSSKKSFRAIESSGETDSAFAKVNHRITEAEVSRLSNQVPLLMLDAVWSEIQSYCKNVGLGVVCTIPQGTITLQLTNEIIAAAEAVAKKIEAINDQQGGVEFEVNEPSELAQLSIISGEYIRLGTITYAAFSAEEEFQYEVSLNFSEMEKIEGLDNDNATILKLKWPANERSVVSSYSFESSDSEYVYTYSYINDGNEESVKIQYSGSDNYPENSANTYTEIVTLKALDASNNVTLVGFEWRLSGEMGMQIFSTVGEVNNDSGTLRTDFSSDYNSEGEAELVSYSKTETFDSNGLIINSAVCEANCRSKGAWTTADSTASSSNTTTINGDKNETTNTATETITESPLIAITVSGLEDDGSYIIALDGFDGGIEGKLGDGSVTEGVAEFIYWGSQVEIGNAKVYTFQFAGEAGYYPGYIAVDSAQITETD